MNEQEREALREQINGEWNATVEKLESECERLRAELDDWKDVAQRKALACERLRAELAALGEADDE